MKIGIIDVDKTGFFNLALSKISQFHKSKGDNVEFYTVFNNYDIVYMSKVFSFSRDYNYYITNAKKIIKGGTGYNIKSKLSIEIDNLQPDYSLYNIKNTSYGFVTRGCPNNCSFCIVPQKEGKIKEYMTIREIAQNNKNVILMDNNILACDFGINQLIASIDLKLNIDCNQGLEAKLITNDIAEILSKIKWIKYLRTACDNINNLDNLIKAINILRSYKKNIRIQVYVLLRDRVQAEKIINTCKELNVFVFSQPFLDFTKKNNKIENWQKAYARYTNRKEIYMSSELKNYKYL